MGLIRLRGTEQSQL